MRRPLKQVPFHYEFVYGGVRMSTVDTDKAKKDQVCVRDRMGKTQWLDWSIEVEIPSGLSFHPDSAADAFSGFAPWEPLKKSRVVHSRLVIVRGAATEPELWEVDGELGLEELRKYYREHRIVFGATCEVYTLFRSSTAL